MIFEYGISEEISRLLHDAETIDDIIHVIKPFQGDFLCFLASKYFELRDTIPRRRSSTSSDSSRGTVAIDLFHDPNELLPFGNDYRDGLQLASPWDLDADSPINSEFADPDELDFFPVHAPTPSPQEEIRITCSDLLRHPQIYERDFPLLPEQTISVGTIRERNVELLDATYMDNQPLRAFVGDVNHVLILSPRDGPIIRGTYFTKDDFNSWITDPNNIVAICHGRAFDYYNRDQEKIYFVRLSIAGPDYYIPYVDIQNFCQDGDAKCYVLEPTEFNLTNIVSLSVMLGADAISSNHCADSTPRIISRLRSLRLEP